MDLELIPRSLQLQAHRPGRPQRCGPLTMLPLFGQQSHDNFNAPLSGLKLAGVHTYGTVELHNPAQNGVTIVPSHVGYIQDQAQNHALCSALLLGAGQKRVVEDACCVQAAQGGLLEDREQWFFILPASLREQALNLRGQNGYNKLWDDISTLNTRFGLPDRGHLEQIISRQRATLTQYQSRLELMPGQTGALFFIQDKLIGVEIAPNADYFREVWMPLVCFCYGATALELERKEEKTERSAVAFEAKSLPDLRQQLQASRQRELERVQTMLAETPQEKFEREEQERFLELRLWTVESENYVGQYVEEDGGSVYASLVARDALIRTALAI